MPIVVAVHSDPDRGVSKLPRERIVLLAGLGAEGDAQAGATVRHRSRMERDPSQPNLRQLHLIHAELHDELREAGFRVEPGLMEATLERDSDGRLVRKAGVMAVVIADGEVRLGDPVRVELPAEPHRPLEPV